MDFFWGKASMSYSEPMVGWWPFLIRDSRIGYQLYMYYCVYNNKVLYSLILYQKNITYKVLYFNGKVQQIIYVHLHMSRNSCPHHTNHCCSHQRTIFFIGYWGWLLWDLSIHTLCKTNTENQENWTLRITHPKKMIETCFLFGSTFMIELSNCGGLYLVTNLFFLHPRS